MIDANRSRRIISRGFYMNDCFFIASSVTGKWFFIFLKRLRIFLNSKIQKFKKFEKFEKFEKLNKKFKKSEKGCRFRFYWWVNERSSLSSVRAGTQKGTCFIVRIFRLRFRYLFTSGQNSPFANRTHPTITGQPRINAFTMIS